jgi:hypothetical protein
MLLPSGGFTEALEGGGVEGKLLEDRVWARI